MRTLKYISCLILLGFYLLVPLQSISASEIPSYYTILLDDTDHLASAQKELSENNIQVVYSVDEIGLLQVKATTNEMKKIGAKSFVSTYNPSIRFTESADSIKKETQQVSEAVFWGQQWDMKQITHNGDSYKIFPGSKNAVVGIIDSGLDIDHPDLKANIVSGSKNFVPKDGFRGEEANETGNIDFLNDYLGHGTFTAGQIAANGKIKGVAPETGIRSYRVFGSKSGEFIWIIKAITEAAKDDVDVINLSLGSYLVNGSVIKDGVKSKEELAEIKAYKKAITFARNQGSVVVAAVGNDSLNVRDNSQINAFYKKKIENENIIFKGKVLDVPADLPGVVAVSSVGPTGELSNFSNYGKNFIDISAPGGDLRLFQKYGPQTWATEGYYMDEQVVSTFPGGGYFFDSGNSVAAPKVSGALALIIDKYHLKDKPNSSVKFLYKYGVDQQNQNRDLFGNGILNVYKALNQ
ncbi:S8 family peptidase [Bacillus thuringiensis]|uniref:S8 family peptidase n=1 Tax=Bacillus thuringiensis TaxID=1428 RepID=UPI000BF25952|nr:S8 family serine peptidase [Bacillus thuringiensis]MCU4986735.1 S8 family serine peptidase [Bacillus cereus]PFF57996.1 peptidase S8 [Bacillus thuringiensis]